MGEKTFTYGSVCSGIEAKVCTACQLEKPLAEFGRQRTGRLGHRAWCKPCFSADNQRHYRANRIERLAKAKARLAENPERHRAARRDQKLRRNYGLTQIDRDAMSAAQGGKCAICAEIRPLKVDHCHATGRVRALLCGPCNTSLGAFRDKPELLERAAAYLREHAK